jgi:hypothetical protein
MNEEYAPVASVAFFKHLMRWEAVVMLLYVALVAGIKFAQPL